MDMEVVTLLTYVCACIGGLLLLACTVLVCVVIYTYCKKNGLILSGQGSNQRYAVIENGHTQPEVDLKRYQQVEDEPIPHKSSVIHVKNEKVPRGTSPVTSRILRKIRKKEKIKDDITFTPDELNVPKEETSNLFRKNKAGLRRNVSFTSSPADKKSGRLWRRIKNRRGQIR